MRGRENQRTRFIARRIRAARRCAGWDRDMLAARSGIPTRRIERYEATGDVPCDDLITLASALGLPITHFLGRCGLCGGA